ncbi:MAG: tRNA lysidine(34) synthetase TilS [Candidatus Deferrimicrobiaceae bacterium]
MKRYANVVAVSGGVDSVYLLIRTTKGTSSTMAAHYNHKARGKDSEGDERFVEALCREYRIPLEAGGPMAGSRHSPEGKDENGERGGFEGRARMQRYRFLLETKEKYGAERILVAHTADDQVETILMRIMEGAGISGLKGIPRATEDAIERPLLYTWREDILRYLEKHGIAHRVDKSNLDTRFERNWIRHVLIPSLEKRYGKSVKKRIFALGERFRELDAFVEQSAHNWLENNVDYNVKKGKSKLPRTGGQEKEAIRIPRKAYAALPSLLRIRTLQVLCYGYLGTAPNERLLASMDRLIVSGRSSARLNVGGGATLRCRYGEAILSPPGGKATSSAGDARFGRPVKGRERKEGKEGELGKAEKTKGVAEPFLRMEGPGIYRWNQPARGGWGVETGSPVSFIWEERGKTAVGRIRKMAGAERQAFFDADMIPLPLSVRPLRVGDRVRPFGLEADKKIKEILIDRKVPRERRWGSPVVCDAGGTIVWIPGILRSSGAAVTPATRRTIVLRADIGGEPPSE